MLSDLLDVLLYAAAMDLYKRCNRRPWMGEGYPPVLTENERRAMLDTVAWDARPALLADGV